MAFSLVRLKKKKRISEKHTEIFLKFLVFLEESKLKKEKQKQEKLFTRESSPQAKEESRNLFRFSFNITTNYTRKKNQKKQDFLDFLEVFQTHKKKARK